MTQLPSALDTRLTGSFSSRFWLELFGNSAHFPIANVLLELLLARGQGYLREPDLYVIVLASVTQAWWLTRWQHRERPRRFLGNLIGPALYTLIEVVIDGPGFFAAPNHLAYWGFSFAVGAAQAAQQKVRAAPGAVLIVLENVVRTFMLFFMYVIFETSADPAGSFSVQRFFRDGSHVYIGLAVLMLGLSGGLANLTGSRYLRMVRETTGRLRVYSEWLLGRQLLQQTFVDPSALALTRRERAVIFMDVRGFTRWSETQPPEAVVSLLDRYYEVADGVLGRRETIKRKFSADEVMAVFASAHEALAAARELRPRVAGLLSSYGLGAGIGLHYGPVVEGLLGSSGVKFYDVIGDTVNTAKRIEGAARTGELLLSDAARDALGHTAVGERVEISAKGKEEPVVVYRWQEARDPAQEEPMAAPLLAQPGLAPASAHSASRSR